MSGSRTTRTSRATHFAQIPVVDVKTLSDAEQAGKRRNNARIERQSSTTELSSGGGKVSPSPPRHGDSINHPARQARRLKAPANSTYLRRT
jgi:hypothetical protein